VQDAKPYIEKTRQELVAATQGLAGDQWTFKPAPDRWSIAEVLEHVVTTQDLVLGTVRERLAAAPPPPADYPTAEIDALIVNAFPDRSARFKGPEVLQPTGRVAPEEALRRFDANCTRLAEFLETTQDLRQHAVESLPLKAISNGKYVFMDGYQWGVTLAAHTARHTAQVLEVRADGHFPAHVGQASVA